MYFFRIKKTGFYGQKLGTIFQKNELFLVAFSVHQKQTIVELTSLSHKYVNGPWISTTPVESRMQSVYCLMGTSTSNQGCIGRDDGIFCLL